jgi:hypothetical protein
MHSPDDQEDFILWQQFRELLVSLSVAVGVWPNCCLGAGEDGGDDVGVDSGFPIVAGVAVGAVPGQVSEVGPDRAGVGDFAAGQVDVHPAAVGMAWACDDEFVAAFADLQVPALECLSEACDELVSGACCREGVAVVCVYHCGYSPMARRTRASMPAAVAGWLVGAMGSCQLQQ